MIRRWTLLLSIAAAAVAGGCDQVEADYCYLAEDQDGTLVVIDSVVPDTSYVCVAVEGPAAGDSVVPDTSRSAQPSVRLVRMRRSELGAPGTRKVRLAPTRPAARGGAAKAPLK